MTLYEIRDQIARILDTGFVVDEDTGEVLADESSLDALKMAEEEKLENIICYRKNLLSEAKAIKFEEESLSKRRKAKEAKASRLDQYIASCMRMSGRDKFETSRCKAFFRCSKSVEFDDYVFYDSAPEQYIRVKREADKNAIKAAIASGTLVSGAALVEKEGLVNR